MNTCRFIDQISQRRVVLASGSPRRRELLASMGVDFIVDVPEDVDEEIDDCIPAMDVAPNLAERKAKAYSQSRRIDANTLVITADTVVISGNRVLGKPADEAEAREMLRELSGRTHQVVTGVCVADNMGVAVGSQITDVTFAQLSDDEINYYIEHYRPMDKAGAYGIQEWIGCIGITRIVGDYYNVMGLPLRLLYEMLTSSLNSHSME